MTTTTSLPPCEAAVMIDDLNDLRDYDICTRPATGWRTDGPDGEHIARWPACELDGGTA